MKDKDPTTQNRKQLKSALFEGQISNGPTHLKTGKNGGFSPDRFHTEIFFLFIFKTV